MSNPSQTFPPVVEDAAVLGQDGSGIPVLPDDATNEQKDEHWFRHVYRGDKMPQLTWRAVLMGGFLGMVMSAANLYTSLQIGWAFGIAITACVLSFVMWNFVVFASRKRVSQMGVLENACMASTASAAGYSTGSTIATMFGALLLLAEPKPGQTLEDVKTLDVMDWRVVGMFTLLTGLLGVFLAIPMKRQMINHEQLKFPSGLAAAETLKSLYSQSKEALQKAYVLVSGIVIGMAVALLRVDEKVLTAIKWLKNLMGEAPIKDAFELPLPASLYPTGTRPAEFQLDTSLLLLAAGMIVGLRVAISLMLSSLILFFIVGPWLAGIDAANLGVEGYKPSIKLGDGVLNLRGWALWGGTAVMVFASLTSVALQWKTLAKAFRRSKGGDGGGGDLDAQMAAIEVPGWWMVVGMVPITIAMVVLQMVAFEVSWYAGIVAVAMSFVLGMVASRATGETDTTPIGAMGKVMQLTFAMLAPKNMTANLASAGIAANSAIGSADLLTDLKTGYMLGANPRRQFLAQFIGVFFGTIAIVPIWYLMVPNRAVLESFSLPSTKVWVAVAKILVEGINQLPKSAQYSILIGAFVGIVLPLIERFTPTKYKKFTPSASAVGLAWVLPFSNCLSWLIGAIIASVWAALGKKSADKFTIPVASGIIAGESLMAAVLAIMATVAGLLAAKTAAGG
ncbi:MAG: OPT family oligopeptide transporter [Planctomycetota bacterium]